MRTLPKADAIVIPTDKFTKYALDPNGDFDKHVAFKRALGYDLNNYKELIDNIRANIKSFNAKEKEDLGHGKRYEVIMKLKGPNGKIASVLTAWIDDKKTGEMRLINAYVVDRKGDDDNAERV
jgi:filamentous hemagglutinin